MISRTSLNSGIASGINSSLIQGYYCCPAVKDDITFSADRTVQRRITVEGKVPDAQERSARIRRPVVGNVSLRNYPQIGMALR